MITGRAGSVGAAALAVTVLVVAVLMLAPSGGGRKAAQPGVFTVSEGMTKSQVRAKAGTPWREGPRCWVYRRVKPGTNIVGMRFCFTRGRVSLVQTSLSTGRLGQLSG
jgi:hypothetical protein